VRDPSWAAHLPGWTAESGRMDLLAGSWRAQA
jgi:hypothetical protein